MREKLLGKICLFLMVMTSFLVGITTFQRVSAYTYDRTIDTTVEVKSATEVQVTQVHHVSWDNPNFFFSATKNYIYIHAFPALESQKKDVLTRVKNIAVTSKYATPTNLKFTTSVVDGAVQIKIPYYEDLRAGGFLEVKATYTTDLYAAIEGGLLEINYPGLSKDYSAIVDHKTDGYSDKTSYKITFVIPKTFGAISSVYPLATQQSTTDKWSLSYVATDLVGKSVRITAGNERVVKFTLSGKTYPTNVNSPDFVNDLLVNYIDVALPTQLAGTEFANQKIYFTKISPYPESLSTDTDGNVIAHIPVSASKEGEVVIEGYAVIATAPLLDSMKTSLLSSIPKGQMQSYLAAEPRYWQVNDPSITSLASKYLDTSGIEYKTLQNSLYFVSKTLTYPTITATTTLERLGAVQALKSKVGVCMEYSDLLLSILRAQGIPTRTVFGDGVGARVERTLEGIGHQWVGVWFPGTGWVSVDPTWSDGERAYIGPDFDHFVWYVASKSVDEPSGFNCQSWDAASPCKDALLINTEAASALPDASTLFTMSDIQNKLEAEKGKQVNVIQSGLQSVVTFLGASQVGRVVLSKQGLLIIFALVLYLVLVIIVSTISKIVRKKKSATVPIGTTNLPPVA